MLREYQKRSGVTVNAVYDTEETKSTGLANRLLAEKARPQADVFWSNEPVRTLVLKSRDVLAPYRSPSAQGIPAVLVDPEGYWTGFSARIRVIAYNTTLVKPDEAPRSVFDLADPKWRGQVAIADPRFGSTSFHVAALYALAGDEKMDDFFRRLKANGVRVVDGNSVVRDLVARGEVKVGLTDTDDVNVAIEDGQPIAMVLPDKDGLGVPVMPNMVSLIANAPHPDEGRKLVDYLLSADVERQLAQSEAVQIPLHAGVPGSEEHPGDRHLQADDARLREGRRAGSRTRRGASPTFSDSEPLRGQDERRARSMWGWRSSRTVVIGVGGVRSLRLLSPAARLPVATSLTGMSAAAMALLLDARQRTCWPTRPYWARRAALSTAIGAPLGITLARVPLKRKNALRVVLAAPMLLPPYVVALAWTYFGPACSRRSSTAMSRRRGPTACRRRSSC